MPDQLLPELFMSGSSDAGAATAISVGATPITYPPPADELDNVSLGKIRGVRIGVLARPDEDTAWADAIARFPSDRFGQMLHKVAMVTSDSVWHKQISKMAEECAHQAKGCYWLEPMRNYKTFCPYLVGSYDAVAADLRRYVALGAETFILDVLGAADFVHVKEVFDRVSFAPRRSPSAFV
jgi:alkanesulfonate monooxygenase